ncbi:MAG: glycosyltransferase [Leadbetterella sp.]
MKNIIILIPVYNDWEVLKLLLLKIKQLYSTKFPDLKVLAIDDCSNVPFVASEFAEFPLEVLHLNCNLSHQRAIAIGLSYIANERKECEFVVVMDSDGEDQPEHVEILLEKAIAEPGKIVFAQRKKRNEGLVFRVFYVVYKMLFKMLTGQVITFGNFSVIPANKLKKLCFVSEIWNNYPGGTMRSKLPIVSILLDRGKRLAGESKMNFNSLILHGMSAISVFMEQMAVRILIFMGLIISGSVLGAIVVLYMKFGLDAATPGWASTVLSTFLTISFLCFIIALLILFLVLSTRRFTSFVPYVGYKNYIDSVDK